jgi:4-amino-4-deoxy-L-arabinose transferase-like glycosyltransferase
MKLLWTFLKRHYSSIILISILALGAFLRLYKINEYLTFLGDEGRDVLIVRRMIVDHKFTLLGPTASVGGFFLGPIYYYFMIPFLWLWNFDPTGPAVMVALFGIATIYLVFRMSKEMFGDEAGIVASSLYALSPLVISYSRSSWNPNIVPFFSTYLMYVLWKRSIRIQKLDFFWIGFFLGIGIQLHYLFMFLYGVTFVWILFLLKRKLFSFSDIFYGIIGWILGASGFLLFEIRHGFPNTQSIISFLRTGKDTGFSIGYFFANIADVSMRLFGRLILWLPDGGALNNLPRTQAYSWLIASYGVALVTIGFLVWFIVRNWKLFVSNVSKKHEIIESKKTALLLLCIWFLAVILLFGFYKKGIYDYYFGIIFTAPFLMFGYFFDFLYKKRIWKWVACMCWLGLCLLNWQGRPFRYPPNNQLAQAELIAKTAFEKTEGKPFNFALVTATNSDHAFRFFFERWGHPPVTIENAVIDPDRATVTDQLIVICEDQNCQPLGHSLWEIAGFGRAEIAGVWEVPFVKIYKLVHYKEQ